jgi:hypothetical protein
LNREEFYQSFESRFAKCIAISRRKNADYCGGSEGADPFHNFRQAPGIAKITLEQGIVVRLTDKLSRLGSLLDPNSSGVQVVDESIDDTLNDVINYCTILGAYRESVATTSSKIVIAEDLPPWESKT